MGIAEYGLARHFSIGEAKETEVVSTSRSGKREGSDKERHYREV